MLTAILGLGADRPGFDQNGQVASGFAAKEGEPGRPKFSPVFYLADLMTGYLAAAGMMAALLRRAEEGGSYHVKLSLARSAHVGAGAWFFEYGGSSVAAGDRYLSSQSDDRTIGLRQALLPQITTHI